MSDEQPSQTRRGAMLDGQIAQAFNLQDNAVLIASDEHPVYRAGDVIVRQEFDPTEANFSRAYSTASPRKGFAFRVLSNRHLETMSSTADGRRGRS
jgi:hypothetical protein